MKDLEGILNSITELIEHYESGAWVSVDELRQMLRELTSNIYYLTKEDIEAYRAHNEILHSFDGSVARAQIEADKSIPELRMTRKIIASANRVADAMRSELSIIKNES